MLEEAITITKEEYDQLLADSEWLECLEASGVDNWDGIDYAIDLKEEREKTEES